MNNQDILNKLKEVKKQGLNIYSLINRFKKERKWPKEKMFPDEVISKVCDQYLKDKDNIKEAWPWFIKALRSESEQWHARQNISEHQRIKREIPILSMRQIMEGMK